MQLGAKLRAGRHRGGLVHHGDARQSRAAARRRSGLRRRGRAFGSARGRARRRSVRGSPRGGRVDPAILRATSDGDATRFACRSPASLSVSSARRADLAHLGARRLRGGRGAEGACAGPQRDALFRQRRGGRRAAIKTFARGGTSSSWARLRNRDRQRRAAGLRQCRAARRHRTRRGVRHRIAGGDVPDPQRAAACRRRLAPAGATSRKRSAASRCCRARALANDPRRASSC